MEILVIGDIHGLNSWKKLVKEKNFDKVVFLGDYVDSFIAPDKDIFKNLQEIIQYKKDNPDTTTLLLGNHDIQYIWEGNGCSGYRSAMAVPLKILFEDNLDLFKLCHEEEGYLFSHAGFTNAWEEHNKDVIDNYFVDGFYSYEQLNDIFFKTSDRAIFCQCGPERGGHSKVSGPLWADKSDTIADGIKVAGLIQVVGHTKVPSIEDKGHIIFCDNLEYGDGKPLIIKT